MTHTLANPTRGQPVRSSDDAFLASAVELNHGELFRLGRILPWVRMQECSDAVAGMGDGTWPNNFVVEARLKSSSAGRRVRELLAPSLKEKLGCDWVVGPNSEPADLGNHLRAAGFTCRIHCAAMACDLKRLPEVSGPPKEVAVRLVAAPPSIVPLTTVRRQRRHQAMKVLAQLEPRRIWHFSASVDGQAVGETMLFGTEEVAGIYCVAVNEKFRRRGIGTALVHAALVQARELGYAAAVLGATGMGQRVYERTGFRTVGRLSFWKYGKMQQRRFE